MSLATKVIVKVYEKVVIKNRNMLQTNEVVLQKFVMAVGLEKSTQ